MIFCWTTRKSQGRGKRTTQGNPRVFDGRGNYDQDDAGRNAPRLTGWSIHNALNASRVSAIRLANGRLDWQFEYLQTTTGRRKASERARNFGRRRYYISVPTRHTPSWRGIYQFFVEDESPGPRADRAARNPDAVIVW